MQRKDDVFVKTMHKVRSITPKNDIFTDPDRLALLNMIAICI